MKVLVQMVDKAQPESQGFWTEINIPDHTPEKAILGERFAYDGHIIQAFQPVGEGTSS